MPSEVEVEVSSVSLDRVDEAADDDEAEVEVVLLVGAGMLLVSVMSPLVTGVIDVRIMVLVPMAVVGAAVTPVVVVTTATLHSSWMAFPSRNSPTILVSATSSSEQSPFTNALIWTRPFKHLFEHICAVFVKSLTLQPGIVVVYATWHLAGRLVSFGVKSERATASLSAAQDSTPKTGVHFDNLDRIVLICVCMDSHRVCVSALKDSYVFRSLLEQRVGDLE